jgi:alpha/beta superfamily hydrolase
MAFRLVRHARIVRFPSADGLSLEGRLTPEPGAGRGAVLCHPHPLYGGSMLNPVVLAAEEAFRAAGYTTLAFNFRGVGGSEGDHGEGEAETADVAGALGRLEAEVPAGPGPRLAVCGYSFGSAVGGRVAAADGRVAWYLGIAPVVARYDYGFLAGARGRVALVTGARDEYAPLAQVEALARGLGGRGWLRVVEADHLFTGALDLLAAACREAIAWAEAPPGPA